VNEDGREPPLELPLLALPGAHPCSGCGDCCTYVAVRIDDPRSNADYDHVHWYLSHRGVSVYVDWDGDFYLEFETRCDHLTAARICAIYRERPEICADFSWDECEKGTGEPGHKLRFETPEQFATWFAARRPKAYARYAAFRRERAAARDRERPRADATARDGKRSAAGKREARAARPPSAERTP
jgi:hypothetical protein